MRPTEMTAYEIDCLANAVLFTAIRWKSLGRVTRFEAPTLEGARNIAATFADGRTMIYAVTATDQSAHIENA